MSKNRDDGSSAQHKKESRSEKQNRSTPASPDASRLKSREQDSSDPVDESEDLNEEAPDIDAAPGTSTSDTKKKSVLFPPTKKYRYYPITCEHCGERFQPNELRKHKKKYQRRGTDLGLGWEKSSDAGTSKRRRTTAGIPRSLKICYICGKMYGSKSIKIHEPNCLEKWRIQNRKLPPDRRAPEPVKPTSFETVHQAEYDVPEYNPAAEAAFRSHVRSLVPCLYCQRTFSPDRILKHESCCIERPRKREYITPEKGELK